MGPCNSHPVSCLLGFGLINSTKHLFDSCPCHMQPHSLPQRKTVCKYGKIASATRTILYGTLCVVCFLHVLTPQRRDVTERGRIRSVTVLL